MILCSFRELLKRSENTGGHGNGLSHDDQCHPKYQQSKVSVFARFVSSDPDSGRVDYYPSRDAELDVTDLIVGGKRAAGGGRNLLRAEDSKVVWLRGTTVEGRRPGRTDIQVLSPLTGQVIGSSEVRVVKSKVSITDMEVRVVTGISLRVREDEESAAGGRQRKIYVAETTHSEALMAKYQVYDSTQNLANKIRNLALFPGGATCHPAHVL